MIKYADLVQFAAGISLLTAATLSAQDIASEPPLSEVPTQAPIIVVAPEKEDRPKVVLGSRIEKQQRVNYTGIATNTGTRGLTPGSGMDQGATVGSIKQSKCTSDDPRIGREAACLMIEADTAIAKDDRAAARDMLAYLTLTASFTPYEKLAGAQRQYRLAKNDNNPASQEAALEQMVGTGAMPPADELKARRALISMAFADGRKELARERLVQLDAIAPLEGRQLANLAILSREQGMGDAEAIMRRAIAAEEEAGRTVAKSWRDFANKTVPD